MPDVQVTITIPERHVQRVRSAFQEALELDNLASLPDVKNYIINDIKQLVRRAERKVAERTVREQQGAEDVELT